MPHKKNSDEWLRERLGARAEVPDPEPFWADFKTRFGPETFAPEPKTAPRLPGLPMKWLFNGLTALSILCGVGIAVFWFSGGASEAANGVSEAPKLPVSAAPIDGKNGPANAPGFENTISVSPENQLVGKENPPPNPKTDLPWAMPREVFSLDSDPAEFHDPEASRSAATAPGKLPRRPGNFVVHARNWSEDSKWTDAREHFPGGPLLHWSDEMEWSDSLKWAERFRGKKDSAAVRPTVVPPVGADGN